MPQTQILEWRGVLHEVVFEPGSPDEGPLFYSVRVLGPDWEPTGLDLKDAYNELYVKQADGSGETILSLLAGELNWLECAKTQ